MRPCSGRRFLSLLVASLLVTSSRIAFQFPLSDESVREAYFLGERHDLSFLGKYIKFLPLPKAGPQITSVTFLTPFAHPTEVLSRHIGSYSAQQARLDHLAQQEPVKITIQVLLTPSYGALIANPDRSRSSSSPVLIQRPYDFWKDFRVQAYDGNQLLAPTASRGYANYHCRRGCSPSTGATLELEFPGEAFTSDSATVLVFPPEGDQVSVDFNLTSSADPLIPRGLRNAGAVCVIDADNRRFSPGIGLKLDSTLG